ncbi:hypothetical protein [Bacteroides sp.]
MNNSPSTPQKITLEDIAQRKQEVLDKIRVQKETMSDIAHQIFAPLEPATSGVNSLMRSINTGMAIFDGVMLGLKMMRKLRAMFKKRR